MTRRYLAFYVDREYEQGDLQDHLNELDRWGGTPDMWDAYDDLGKAIDAVREQPDRMVVVDDVQSYRYLYEHNPEAA